MAETVGVPITILSDSREFIAAQDAAERPEVLAFIWRFSNYWVPDIARDGWVGPPKDKASE